MKAVLLELYQQGLAAVHGARVVTNAVGTLQGTYALVALGKAASAMTRGILASDAVTVARGFVCVPHGYEPFTPPDSGEWAVHAGGHPLPDDESFKAGAALVDWLAALPTGLPLLVLMSGGASSSIEHLREGLARKEVIERTRVLLASGADIRALNAARSEWSTIKGGRAARRAGLRDIEVFVLVDVPGDDPAFVGSGPFYGRTPSLRVHPVAGNADLLAAIAEAARSRGLEVTINGTLSGDAARMGRNIVTRLQSAAPGIHLWGGETTVALPDTPGRGGRCQHLALAGALELAGNPAVTLLAAGTDGVDGNSQDAGALVDGSTVARIAGQELDPADALARADSGTALEAAGDLLHTGPTGTNVMDVVIAMLGVPPRGG